MLNNCFASYATAKPTLSSFSFSTSSNSNSQPSVSLEELEQQTKKKLEKEAKKTAELKKAEALPTHLTVGISAANGDIRNRNKTDTAAVANGIIMCDIIRIHKGGTIYFYTADGELNEDTLVPNQRLALHLGDKAEQLVSDFMELAASPTGGRSASIKIAISEEVDMNSMSTVEVSEVYFLSELKAGISRPPANKKEYLETRNEVIAKSKDYKKQRREENKKKEEVEREAQLMLAMGVAAPTNETAPSGQPSEEEAFDPNESM